jgi:hypothetical protein
MVERFRPPTMAWPGRIAANVEEPLVSVVRGAEPPTGPSMPHPMEKAPHQDLGELISDFIGDLQGAGELASSFLDQPFHQTLNIDGPHRMVDNVLDVQSGVVRGLIRKVLKRGK